MGDPWQLTVQYCGGYPMVIDRRGVHGLALLTTEWSMGHPRATVAFYAAQNAWALTHTRRTSKCSRRDIEQYVYIYFYICISSPTTSVSTASRLGTPNDVLHSSKSPQLLLAAHIDDRGGVSRPQLQEIYG